MTPSTRRSFLTEIGAKPDQATVEALRHVCANLREKDRREIHATQWSDDPDELMKNVLFCPIAAWLAWWDGRPVAAVGALPVWPRVWSVWAFGTDDFRRVGLLLTRHIHQYMIPMLKASAHRVECRSIEGHDEAHRWLETFGMRREARHENFGRGGETFFTYAWTGDRDVQQRG